MKNANDHFGSSNGTENYYRHLGVFVYTDGVKELAETCKAYWLIDLIISHQAHKHVEIYPFQVWQLQRVKNDVFTIVADDGDGHKITSQDIPFSDFTYDTATLWLVQGTLMLPCEY